MPPRRGARRAQAEEQPETDMRDMQRVVQGMLNVLERQAEMREDVPPARVQAPVVDPDERQARAFSRFQARGSPTFDGGPVTKKAEEFIKLTQRALEVVGTPEEYKVPFGTFMLVGEAERWWASIAVRREVSDITWEQFVELFNANFIRKAYRQARLREFIQLEQGDMSVAEYAAKFTELSLYGAQIIADEQMKAIKFQDGLKMGIRSRLVVHQLGTYDEVLEAALLLEQEFQYAHTQRASQKKVTSRHQGQQSGNRGNSGSGHYSGNSSGSGGKSWKNKRHSGNSSGSGSSSGSGGRTTPYSRPGNSQLGGPQDSSSRRCYHCRQPGHVQAFCPILGSHQADQQSYQSAYRPFQQHDNYQPVPAQRPAPLQQRPQIQYPEQQQQYQLARQPQQQQQGQQQRGQQQRRQGGGNQQARAFALVQPDEEISNAVVEGIQRYDGDA